MHNNDGISYGKIKGMDIIHVHVSWALSIQCSKTQINFHYMYSVRRWWNWVVQLLFPFDTSNAIALSNQKPLLSSDTHYKQNKKKKPSVYKSQ